MRKCLPFTFFIFQLLCFGHTLKAQSNSLYDELVSVNAEWKNQPDVKSQLKSEAAKPIPEQQLIQFHLAETEKLLRSRDVSNLSPQQKANRLKNLDVLHQYMLAGVYPINTNHINRQPYFIDDNNTYCAVGYLMEESGADSIARSIHETQNFSYLKDIVHKDLLTWVEQSGLTIDELALIQPTYPGDWIAIVTEFHYNNAGKDVNEYIEIHQATGISNLRFNAILFFDKNDTLYKTLPITEMQQTASDTNIYYYLFPASDSFADIGWIAIVNQYQGENYASSIIDYNSDSVTFTNYGAVKNYMIAENETTPLNTSLSFCGNFPFNLNLISQQASIGIPNPCIVLPVTFGNFLYTINQNKVNLSWETLTETNSQSLSIERSNDGLNFKEIGSLPAAGNNGSAKQYHYTDNDPQYINYYRLKQIDINGSSAYSKVLYVKVETASKLILQQTIVNADLIYQNALSSNGSRIDVYDLSGKRIFSGNAGSGIQHINVSSFAAGKYFIRLIAADGQVYTQQFIKQ